MAGVLKAQKGSQGRTREVNKKEKVREVGKALQTVVKTLVFYLKGVRKPVEG